MTGPDYRAVFAAIPVPSAIFDPQLRIVDVNLAYVGLTSRGREALIGQTIYEAFGLADDAPRVAVLDAMTEALRDAFRTGDVTAVPTQRLRLPDPMTGQLLDRAFTMTAIPVRDEAGEVTTVLLRARDISRQLQAESDLHHRAEALTVALLDKEQASRRLTGLAEVALQLAGATTLFELTRIVIERGLGALGANGGALGVIDGELLMLTLTNSLGAETAQQYPSLVLHESEVSLAHSARTGEVVLLPTLEELLAWSPSMLTVYEQTGKPAWATLPLVSGGRVLGALGVSWAAEHQFPDDEVELLRAFASQTAQALDRLQIREAERILEAEARSLSETLQRSLLTEPPQPRTLQIAVRYLPAAREAQIGGDWYDAFLTPDGDTTIVIGDVSGHDRMAAAAMGQIRNVLRGVAQCVSDSPGTVLTALDRAMRNLEINVLATAVVAQIHQSPAQADAGRRTLQWSNAGHPPPLLLHPSGTAELLQHAPDILLGADPDSERSDHEVILETGSTVLLYTDGLVEVRGERLDDGVERLRNHAANMAHLPVEELCDAIIDAMGGGLEDDVALVALRALES